MDLREPLPFANETVSAIYAEHFIEHITREEGLRLLNECARVLQWNGIIRLSTPDLAWLAQVYLKREIHHWEGLWQPRTPAQMVNEGMRSWGHQFVYDREELIDVLNEAGFSAVREMPWRQSSISVLNGIEQRPFHREIIIEAAKDNSVFK